MQLVGDALQVGSQLGHSVSVLTVLHPIIAQFPDGPHIFWFDLDTQFKIATGWGAMVSLIVLGIRLQKPWRPRPLDE
jgi:hypothetical protein